MDKTNHNEYVRTNWLIKTNSQIGRELGISECAVRRSAKRQGLPSKSAILLNKFTQTLQENNMPTSWDYGWLKSDGASIFVKNPEIIMNFEEKKNEFIENIKKIAPPYKKYIYNKLKEKHLLIIDAADIHIGKLAINEKTGATYNVEIAINRVKTGLDTLLQRTSNFPVEKIVLVIGNDILHTDNPFSTTTRGTNQDTDGMWFDNYKKAFDLYVEMVEKLTTLAPVHVIHCPSNHDWTSGYFLAHSLEAFFSRNKNVTFDVTIKHRKAFIYGDNLIGFTHGDGAKEIDLPQLMAQEFRDEWGKTKRGYWYCHHKHHYNATKFKDGKDYIGVTVEYLRSVSGEDRWHEDKGYISPQSMYAFVHDMNGQCAKIIHNF